MEKILVAMDTEMSSLWAFVYALNLAKRMQIKISILLVSRTPYSIHDIKENTKGRFAIKDEIEKLIAEGRSEGICIDYYNTSGSYKEEIIKFIRENKIDLLVIEEHLNENMAEFIKEIKLRTYCRIELVRPKDINT